MPMELVQEVPMSFLVKKRMQMLYNFPILLLAMAALSSMAKQKATTAVGL